MTTIKVTVDSDTGTITVFNDGDGIPVVVHPTYNTDGDDADDGNSDVEEALLCLNEMRRSSSTLTKEEKAILGQAARRIRGKSCACVIL